MKNLILIATLVFSFSSFAREVICVDDFNSDEPTVAQFKNIGTKEVFVELFIPKDDSEGSTYTGNCKKEPGIELSISCNIMTSTDSGYKVRLYSKGGAKLDASVARWNMVGTQKAKILACDDVEE